MRAAVLSLAGRFELLMPWRMVASLFVGDAAMASHVALLRWTHIVRPVKRGGGKHDYERTAWKSIICSSPGEAVNLISQVGVIVTNGMIKGKCLFQVESPENLRFTSM